MLRFVLILSSVFTLHVHAAIGDITCTARQFEVAKEGLKNLVEKPLVLEHQSGTSVVYSVEIGPRAFVLNGDTATGDFLITQAWGQDYTTGINATGSFTSTGRLQISLVDKTFVFKLECRRTQASDFPKE